MTSLDYIAVMNDLLENLECNNIISSDLCIDTAMPVVKGLNSIDSMDESYRRHLSLLQIDLQMMNPL